ERRALHELRPRLRPRRGIPGAVRAGRRRARGMAAVPRRVPRRRRGRLPEGGPMTRADVCVVACAEAWRGDGAILASPMGLIPSLGARLARLTFAPDLLLTDGEAYLVDSGGGVEGWLPYAKVFTMLAAGLRHVMMGAAQIDRHGNQNISCIGD